MWHEMWKRFTPKHYGREPLVGAAAFALRDRELYSDVQRAVDCRNQSGTPTAYARWSTGGMSHPPLAKVLLQTSSCLPTITTTATDSANIASHEHQTLWSTRGYDSLGLCLYKVVSKGFVTLRDMIIAERLRMMISNLLRPSSFMLIVFKDEKFKKQLLIQRSMNPQLCQATRLVKKQSFYRLIVGSLNHLLALSINVRPYQDGCCKIAGSYLSDDDAFAGGSEIIGLEEQDDRELTYHLICIVNRALKCNWELNENKESIKVREKSCDTLDLYLAVTAVAGVSGLLCAWCISSDSEEHFRRYPAHVTYSGSTVLLADTVAPAPRFLYVTNANYRLKYGLGKFSDKPMLKFLIPLKALALFNGFAIVAYSFIFLNIILFLLISNHFNHLSSQIHGINFASIYHTRTSSARQTLETFVKFVLKLQRNCGTVLVWQTHCSSFDLGSETEEVEGEARPSDIVQTNSPLMTIDLGRMRDLGAPCVCVFNVSHLIA
ncbi:hypothetical protein EAG_14261 [Camponotus floridanus]|uniref:Uncharacterized protein n=1 Tax=Camponotus floridanus TaxID=104421 RepID=E2A4D1_CAMFO|nr:hypothetical protein EAG_14261 [Camponotus floridanus]